MRITKTKVLKREFADLLGCLPIVVSRLVKTGEVKVGIDGKIDISSKKMKDYIKNKKLEIQQHREKITKKEIKITKEFEKEAENSKTKCNEETNSNNAESKNLKDQPSFHSVEYETKLHKLESEKHKAELLEMEVCRQRKDLIETNILNKIITKTIGTLSKNIIEIPNNIVDEIIDMVKSEEEPKPLIINLITKALHKEIESTINKVEKEFLKL